MANKGAPSGMLSIVGRRCAQKQPGSQEDEKKEGEPSAESTEGRI